MAVAARKQWKALDSVRRGGMRNGGLGDSPIVRSSIDSNWQRAARLGVGDLRGLAHNAGFLNSKPVWEGLERTLQQRGRSRE